MCGPWWSATVRVMHRVLIAGSGVAAVEAVLALRHLAGRNFEIDLLAPEHALEHRPASVATPFGLGAPPPLDLQRLARRYDVELVQDELLAVDPAAHAARLTSGARWPYDHLLIAVGARPEPALPGALTFRGPVDVPAVERVLAEVTRGDRRHVVVVVPPGSTWPLPAYELAVMAATETRSVAGATVTLVTPEREPLWIFGDTAGAELRELLADRGVVLRTAARAAHVTDDVLWLESGEALIGDTRDQPPAARRPRHPRPAQRRRRLPADRRARLREGRGAGARGRRCHHLPGQAGRPRDPAGRRRGSRHRAGARRHRRGAPVRAGPARAPVDRRGAALPAGGARCRGRTTLGAARRRRLAGEVSSRALWWPPGKVAGRYLAPYLSTARPASLGDEPLVDRAPGAGGGAADDRDAALDLALLLADEDAEAGDLPQALHALDAAAALAGGVLPAAYAERRRRWLSETRSAP